MRSSRLVDVTRGVLIAGMILVTLQAAVFLLGDLGLGLDFPPFGQPVGSGPLGQWVPDGLYIMHAEGELAIPPTVDIDLTWVDGPNGTTDAATGLPAVELTGPWTASVRLLNPSRTDQFAYVAVNVLTRILIAVILWVLLRIVSSIRRGTPFTRANGNRLWVLAGLAGIGGTLAGIAHTWLNNYLIQNSAAARAFQPTATLELTPLLVGLLLVVLAITWSRGIALEADTEGLI